MRDISKQVLLAIVFNMSLTGCFQFQKEPVFTSVSNTGTTQPDTATIVPSKANNPIMVSMSMHIDPVGVYKVPTTPSPQASPSPQPPLTEQERIDEYASRREAILALKDMAAEKGFKISAYMTGPYAEFVTTLKHESDFADFMPGKRHVLGTHLHQQYKRPENTVDPNMHYQWTDCDPQVGCDLKDMACNCRPRVWIDNVVKVNDVFKALGASATDNKIEHAAHRQCPDDSLARCLGTDGKSTYYPNSFFYAAGARDLYHPYRSPPPSDPSPTYTPLKMGEVRTDDLRNSKFISMACATEGIFGFNDIHLPENIWMDGTLEFAQRDYIMEYIEWLYSKTWDKTSRPWVFELSFHPHDILKGKHEKNGQFFTERTSRDALSLFYSWLNDNFKDTFTYANYYDAVDAYKKWETANPGKLIFTDPKQIDSSTGVPAASPTPSATFTPYRYNGNMIAALRNGHLSFSSMNRTSDSYEVFVFRNANCNKWLPTTWTPEEISAVPDIASAVLVYSKKGPIQFDLKPYLHLKQDSVNSPNLTIIPMGGVVDRKYSNGTELVDSKPVLFLDVKLTLPTKPYLCGTPPGDPANTMNF